MKKFLIMQLNIELKILFSCSTIAFRFVTSSSFKFHGTPSQYGLHTAGSLISRNVNKSDSGHISLNSFSSSMVCMQFSFVALNERQVKKKKKKRAITLLLFFYYEKLNSNWGGFLFLGIHSP